MVSDDGNRLEALGKCLVRSQAAVRSARENLIEALGDHLCGSGAGPSPRQLEAFDAAKRQEAVARRNMARFVARLARKIIARVRYRALPRRSAPSLRRAK